MEKIFDNLSILEIIEKEYNNEFFDITKLFAINTNNSNQFIIYGDLNLDNIDDLKIFKDFKEIKQIESNLNTFLICTKLDNSLIIDNISDIYIYKTIFPDRIDIDFDKKEWTVFVEKIKIESDLNL
nr:MAG TPA: hypothetical protein [Caudoviricetes sp.]